MIEFYGWDGRKGLVGREEIIIVTMFKSKSRNIFIKTDKLVGTCRTQVENRPNKKNRI